MKGAIACFVAASARFITRHRASWPGSISLLITGDEEGPSINGTAKVLDWLKERGERLDAAIVGEPSNPDALGDELKIGRRGSLNGDLVVHGRQGHSAYPELADNPVPKLARFIERLANAAIDERTEHFQASSLAITIIDVPNTATNVIPSSARARFNVRYNDRWKRPTIEAFVRSLCEQAAAEIGARYSLTFSGTGEVFLTSPGPFVDILTEAVAAETGRRPALTTGGGTSDARFIQAFCPVVEFGLVNKTIHQVDEHVPVADLEKLTRIYERFLARYFGFTSA
jgi:succinyl-diaminopimelate desuccinylase